MLWIIKMSVIWGYCWLSNPTVNNRPHLLYGKRLPSKWYCLGSQTVHFQLYCFIFTYWPSSFTFWLCIWREGIWRDMYLKRRCILPSNLASLETSLSSLPPFILAQIFSSHLCWGEGDQFITLKLWLLWTFFSSKICHASPLVLTFWYIDLVLYW